MKTLKLALVAAIFSGSVMAADDQVTGTITLTGALAPKAISIEFALNDCLAGTTLAACKSTLNAATFTGHATNKTLAVGNLATTTSVDNRRFIQFEAKTKMILFKNDYLQFIAALTAVTNDIEVKVRELRFVRGGKSTFGQTTLGNATSSLALNEAMLTGVELDLTSTLTTLWDQTVENPAQTNDKVFLATATGDELVVRGVLELAFGDEATSSNYSAEITAGFVAKDN